MQCRVSNRCTHQSTQTTPPSPTSIPLSHSASEHRHRPANQRRHPTATTEVPSPISRPPRQPRDTQIPQHPETAYPTSNNPETTPRSQLPTTDHTPSRHSDPGPTTRPRDTTYPPTALFCPTVTQVLPPGQHGAAHPSTVIHPQRPVH